MTHEPWSQRSLTGSPRRMIAVGSAAVICLLSVSGALGYSLVDGSSSQAGHVSQPDGFGGTSLRGANAYIDGPGGVSSSQQAPVRPGDTTGPASQSTALPTHSGEGRRVVFDVSAQRVWLVGADGTSTRTYLVSGSKFHNLSPGTYHVYSRSATARAYNSDETMRYMVRFATGRTGAPIGFHSVPAFPNGKLVEPKSSLGTPQSDGCVRQWLPDARALWNFADIDTTVVVRA